MDATRTDDGVLWVEKAIAVPPNTSLKVSVRFQVWSEHPSSVNQWQVVAFVGADRPTQESDFAIVGLTDQVAGWKEYTYSTTVQSDFMGRIYVAVGINAVWEYARAYYIDDILATYFE